MSRRTIRYAQNFLTDRSVANKLVKMINQDRDLLYVDIGAGSGIITDACIENGKEVWAIEADHRLSSKLVSKYKHLKDVFVLEGDLNFCNIPTRDFAIVANPPFNQSTALIKRWITVASFREAALIVQDQFARKLKGEYGASKLSLALTPYYDFLLPMKVSSTSFNPVPRASVSVLHILRKSGFDSSLEWEKRYNYWRFINYLFERSRPIIKDALKPLDLSKVSRSLLTTPVSVLDARMSVNLFEDIYTNSKKNRHIIKKFNKNLASQRRMETLGFSH